MGENKEQIIGIDEQIRIESVYKRNGLALIRSLEITTDQGNNISISTEKEIEFLLSEEGNYIEYEYDDNKVLYVIKDFLNYYSFKLYLTKDLMDYLSDFEQDISTKSKLDGYVLELEHYEGMFEDFFEQGIKLRAMKELYRWKYDTISTELE